jgi:O-methyltransferase involved in polyketide biosynthesis
LRHYRNTDGRLGRAGTTRAHPGHCQDYDYDYDYDRSGQQRDYPVEEELAALREAVPGGQHAAAPPLDARAPNIARAYNYLLGGKDHYAADRKAADSVLADFPEIALVARANREFVTRSVRHVARLGVTQFIDAGAGLPASPAVHEAAQQAAPAARAAYVDNDPLVLAHARALLAGGPGVTVVDGDLRDPEAILGSPALRGLIDLGQPLCVLLTSVLHFLTAAEADAAVAAFTTAMAGGSYLIVSAGTSTGTDPALIEGLRSAYAGASVITGRTEQEIAAWFTGLDLLPPGLVEVQAWRPASRRYWLTSTSARMVGAVGRKPATSTRALATDRIVYRNS